MGEEPSSQSRVFSTSGDDEEESPDSPPSISTPSTSRGQARFSPADLTAIKMAGYAAIRCVLAADVEMDGEKESNPPQGSSSANDSLVSGLVMPPPSAAFIPLALRPGSSSEGDTGFKRRFASSSETSSPQSSDFADSTGGGRPSSPRPDPPRTYEEIEVRMYEHGAVVVLEGERAGGLVMVLEGLLEVAVEGAGASAIGGQGGIGLSALGSGTGTGRRFGGAKRGVFGLRPYRVGAGGIVGYISAMTSHPSSVTVRAVTVTWAAFFPKPALDRMLERHPAAVFALAKRLLRVVTPSAMQVDMATEWVQLQAGQTVCRQGEKAESVVVVLNGRLRSIIVEDDDGGLRNGSEEEDEEERLGRTGTRFGRSRRGGTSNDALAPDSPPLRATNGPSWGGGGDREVRGGDHSVSGPSARGGTPRPAFTIEAEHGPGDSFGELEVLTDSRRPATVHAIRDSEVAILPRTLLEAMARINPEVTMAVSRIVAGRAAGGRTGKPRAKNWGLSPGSFNVPSYMPAVGGGTVGAGDGGVGLDNANLRTVAVIPVTSAVPVLDFAARLRTGLLAEGCSPVSVLTSDRVVGWLGRHAFSRVGKLKLVSWLAEMEEASGMVVYVADGGVASPWTQRCIRQADCILLVGLGDEDPSIGEFETILIGMKTTARKELVLIHSERYVIPGSTAHWLQNRTWVHAHHHVQMPNRPTIPSRKTNFNLASQIQRFTSRAVLYSMGSTGQFHDHVTHLSSTTESNIRADFGRIARRLLGKSVGLVLGGGGARGIAHVGVIKALEEAGVPIDMVGGTSIGAFVGGLLAREGDYVSTVGRAKMFSSRMASPWRQLADLTYPTLSWFSDNGNMLVDGGYISNLPADVMRALGAARVLAVDVGALDDTRPVQFGDALSGLSVVWDRMNPFRDTTQYQRIPNLADVQSRLAYVSSVRQLEEAKATEGVFYLRPPVTMFGTLQFGSFSELVDVGYKYGLEAVEQWVKDGTMERVFGVKDITGEAEAGLDAKAPSKSRRGRRNSV
ncbi:phosphatidylcholine and lysophosphatidylcholine phospholipase [Gonapodya sp. JEL0774]|nr:phosphatidylcholine and lysophosphatidylcholine phospholipase [Gonapodya sp. JEL0774]